MLEPSLRDSMLRFRGRSKTWFSCRSWAYKTRHRLSTQSRHFRYRPPAPHEQTNHQPPHAQHIAASFPVHYCKMVAERGLARMGPVELSHPPQFGRVPAGSSVTGATGLDSATARDGSAGGMLPYK